jgi:hypothetical protein
MSRGDFEALCLCFSIYLRICPPQSGDPRLEVVSPTSKKLQHQPQKASQSREDDKTEREMVDEM